MKKVLVTVIALSTFMSAYAGGLLTNTNQSVHFLRNPARDASMEIDAVYTNPAGLAKLPVNGWHFSFSNQSAFQKRTITSTFDPFAQNGGNATKEFEGKATSPIIPSLFAVYKMDKWAFSMNLGVIGGGGKATFDNGVPSFEAGLSQLPGVINLVGMGIKQMVPNASLTASQYSVDAKMEGSSIIYDGQLGATYAINDMFSVYAGGRVNFVNNGYKGHLRNLQVNPTSENLELLGMKNYDGTPINAPELIDMAIAAAETDEQKAQLGLLRKASTPDGVRLDCTQSGMGITPILGFNFNWQKLNVGIKYEFNTKLDVKNKTDVDDPGMFPDGEKTPYDIPALLTAGVQYAVIPSVKISAGYHHFFDSNARMAEVKDPNDPTKLVGKQTLINGGINEVLLGAEWQINKMFLVSAGGQYTMTGVTDDYQSDLSHSFNSYSIGMGGAITVSKSVRINLAYFFTKYENWTKKSDYYNGLSMPNPNGGDPLPLPGTDVYSRTNNVFGIGVDFRF